MPQRRATRAASSAWFCAAQDLTDCRAVIPAGQLEQGPEHLGRGPNVSSAMARARAAAALSPRKASACTVHVATSVTQPPDSVETIAAKAR